MVKLSKIHSSKPGRSDYSISLMAANGQVVYNKEVRGGNTGVISIKREPSKKPGLYFLKIQNIGSGIVQIEKLGFE